MIVHLNDPEGWYKANEPGELVPIDPPIYTSRQRKSRRHITIAGITVPADDHEAIREAQEAARDR